MQPQDDQNEAPSWDAVAQAFQDAEDNDEEDAPPFSIMSDGLLGGMTEKIPLEEAANLLLARQAAALIRKDEISAEEYLEMIFEVAQVADNGIKLFSTEVVKKETEKLPEDQQELVRDFEEQVYVLKEGTDLMASYIETNNIDDLDRGLQLVEQSMLAVDQIQDRALELREFERQQAELAADVQAAEEDASAQG